MSTMPLGQLPLDRLLQANAVCNRFESALRENPAVRVDDFLTEVSEEDRTLVRRELEAILQARAGDAESRPPSELGEYTLQGLLGSGGMGEVYRATHRTLKRAVAVKFLAVPSTEQQTGADERFRREVEILGRLQHPNLVLAFDAGRQGGWRYLVTELVDGMDLAAWVRTHGPMSPEQALDVLEQTCRGLAYLHGQGIVHRDLKPANLMLDKPGRIRILDVGLARVVADNMPPALTRPGWILGTVD